MQEQKNRENGRWGLLLVISGVGVCCAGHVLALVGGLAALSGFVTAWSWLVFTGIALAGASLWLYRSRMAKEHASK